MIVLTILAALFLPYLIIYLYKNAYNRPKNFPPGSFSLGPPSLPIYGAFWIVLAHGFTDLASAFKKLGEKYQTKILGLYMGPVPTVVLNDPELIKEMLNREEFDGRMDIILFRLRSFWKKLGKFGIFFTDGYFWHLQRRFSLRYLRDYGFGRRSEELESVVATEVKEMIDLRISGPKYPVETV
uniref:SFRICE005078.2 n=1 Tax=Spodoptera frugiperda TaxID=7108 RepID=A0A2H1VJP4_SPOFR